MWPENQSVPPPTFSNMFVRGLYVVILLPQLATAARNYAFYFRNVSCVAHTRLVENTSCHLHWSAANVSMINLTVRLNEDVNLREVYSKLEYDNNMKTNFQTKIDGCAFLQNGGLANIGKVYHQLRTSSNTNFPYKCPLKKGVDYYVRDFFLDPERFPAYSPDVKFKVTLSIRRGRLLLYTFSVNGQLENFKANNWG